MKNMTCDQESLVVQAFSVESFSTGSFDESLRQHALQCGVCSNALLISRYLRSELEKSSLQLPDPGIIWWKAQIIVQRRAAERATLPARVAQAVARFAASGAVIWICLNKPLLSKIAHTLFPAAGIAGSLFHPNPTVLGAALALGILVVWRRRIWAEFPWLEGIGGRHPFHLDMRYVTRYSKE